MIRTVGLALVLWVGLFVAPTLAQDGGSRGLSTAQTDRVVTAIQEVFDACTALTMVYHPDCVNRALQRGAGKISNNPGYWEAHVALTRIVRNLTRLVRENADPEASRAQAAGYRLKAVRVETLDVIARSTADGFARAAEDLQRVPAVEAPFLGPISDVIRNKRPWP